MDEKDLKNLFKETASAATTPAGAVAYKEFCSALTTPILQEVRLRSVVRGLFAEERLGPGADASYPVADDFEVPVYVLPGLGKLAQNMIEGVGEEVYVPTFSIMASADWKVDYARDGRTDIAMRAARAVARDLARYEEESGWRILTRAACSAFAGQGLLRPRPAPIYQVPTGSDGAGFFSKELLNLMIVGFARTGRTLTDLWVSPEDMADIREWGDLELDQTSRREVFQVGGMGSLWGVTFHEIPHLGPRGKFNINGNSSDFGPFKGDGSENFFDYSITNPNVVDANGILSTAGECQVWGFDLSVNDSLVMPIRKDYEAVDDPTLLRSQKAGFFGHETLGFACLDARMLGIGVIDRSL